MATLLPWLHYKCSKSTLMHRQHWILVCQRTRTSLSHAWGRYNTWVVPGSLTSIDIHRNKKTDVLAILKALFVVNHHTSTKLTQEEIWVRDTCSPLRQQNRCWLWTGIHERNAFRSQSTLKMKKKAFTGIPTRVHHCLPGLTPLPVLPLGSY